MPIGNGQEAGGGENTEKLPVVRQGEDLQTWLRRAVPALVEGRGLSEDDAREAASEAWSRVNGQDKIAGEAPPPADESAEPAGEPPEGDKLDQEQPGEDVQPPPQAEAEQKKDAPQEDEDKAPEPAEEPAEDKSEETSPESEGEKAEDDPPADAQMEWDKQSTWQGDADAPADEAAAPPAVEEDAQPDEENDIAAMAGEVDAGGGAMPQPGTIVEWFADQLYGFAAPLAAHLQSNGYCDERQAQELVAAAAELAEAFSVSVNERLQQPKVTQFSFTIPLPDPDQFARIAGDMPVGAPGKAYRAPHYGRPGQRGGSAPRLTGKERVDTPEFRRKVDEADNKLYDDVLDAFRKGEEVGFSYHPVSEASPTAGYALSPYPQRSKVFDVKALKVADIADYMIGNAEMWGDKNHYLGGWLDRKTGKFYLDVSIVVPTPEQAEKLTRQHKERAYFDIGKGETVFVTSIAEHEGRQLAKSWAAGPDVQAPYIRRFSTERHPLADGLAIKALGPNRVGAYLCLWGSQSMKDLSGEWFAPDTEEMTSIFKAVGVLPAIYHHALDDSVKSTVVGLVDVMEQDETGLWIEAQIKEHEAYQRLIQPLVQKGMLGWSSGALPGGRRVNKATGKIVRWPIVEASMTPSPMEWRMAAQWPIQHIKGIYRLAGLPVQAVENLVKADASFTDLEREMELIRLLELSNNDL